MLSFRLILDIGLGLIPLLWVYPKTRSLIPAFFWSELRKTPIVTFEFQENSAYTVRTVCYGKFAYRAHLDNGDMNTCVRCRTDVRFSRFAEILWIFVILAWQNWSSVFRAWQNWCSILKYPSDIVAHFPLRFVVNMCFLAALQNRR